jgi:hypothetical protein
MIFMAWFDLAGGMIMHQHDATGAGEQGPPKYLFGANGNHIVRADAHGFIADYLVSMVQVHAEQVLAVVSLKKGEVLPHILRAMHRQIGLAYRMSDDLESVYAWFVGYVCHWLFTSN